MPKPRRKCRDCGRLLPVRNEYGVRSNAKLCAACRPSARTANGHASQLKKTLPATSPPADPEAMRQAAARLAGAAIRHGMVHELPVVLEAIGATATPSI